MNAREIIKKHLEDMASRDANFRARYEDKDKSLDECLKYITEQARKQSVNRIACITSDEVFGWAVHYYQEKEVTPSGTEVKAEITAAPAKDPKEEDRSVPMPKPAATAKKKTKAKKTERKELDLFAF